MGWASGLQAGIQLGNAFNQGQERRRMEEIQGTTASELQDYSPSQLQQIQGLQRTDAYDVQAIPGENGAPPTLRYVPKQGLDLQGDMPSAPIDVAPQRMTSFLGQRYEGALSPERMESIRTRAMANAITDPLRRQQALLAVTGEERAQAAESRAAKGFESEQAVRALQTKGLERADKEAERMQAFETDFNALENKNDMDAVRQLAAKNNLSRAQQFTIASQISGIEKTELEMMDTYIKKATKDKDLDGLLNLHKNDKKFADGTHFVKAVGDKGQVILNLVSDADPTKVLRTESFKNGDLATAYLRKQAEDPGMVAEWTLGVRKLEAQIGAAEASTTKDRALGGYYASGGSSGLKGAKAQVAAFKDLMGRDPTEKEKAQMLGLVTKDSSKPEFNPKDYAATIKSFVDTGLSPAAAKIEADTLYGRLAPTADEDAGLLELDKNKNKSKGGVEKEPPPAAAEKRFIREKTNRGAYTYTESPRGLTRAQYVEIDRNK